MRRLAALLTVAAVLLLALAGCGSHSPKPTTSLDAALGYFASDAPFVAAIQTDPDAPQVKQAAALLDRFPVRGELASRLRSLTRLHSVDYDRDIRPQLGAPLVVGLTRPAAPGGLSIPLVVAMKLAHPLKAKQSLLRQPGFLGRAKSSGARIYEDRADSRYAAVDGDVFVAATNKDILEQALAMRRSDNRMRASGFAKDLDGLPKDALVRLIADPRSMIGVDPRLRPALDVKWLASMRRLGATLQVSPTGVAGDFRIATDAGSLKDADLPFAPKPGPLPLIGGNEDIQVGVREPGRLARLAVEIARAVAPRRIHRVRSLEPPGVDLERQLPRHLADLGVLAFNPFTRGFAARAAVHDAPDVKSGIAALAPVLPDVAAVLGIPALGLATPAAGESFYALAKPSGKTVVFGVVGNSLVASNDAARAARLASARTHRAPAPPAAAVFTMNARAIATRLLADRLGGAGALAASLVLGPLRDLTGWIVISRNALRGHVKLTIVR